MNLEIELVYIKGKLWELTPVPNTNYFELILHPVQQYWMIAGDGFVRKIIGNPKEYMKWGNAYTSEQAAQSALDNFIEKENQKQIINQSIFQNV